jgi:hypothetical protein
VTVGPVTLPNDVAFRASRHFTFRIALGDSEFRSLIRSTFFSARRCREITPVPAVIEGLILTDVALATRTVVRGSVRVSPKELRNGYLTGAGRAKLFRASFSEHLTVELASRLPLGAMEGRTFFMVRCQWSGRSPGLASDRPAIRSAGAVVVRCQYRPHLVVRAKPGCSFSGG